jgi:hypothetical protein
MAGTRCDDEKHRCVPTDPVDTPDAGTDGGTNPSYSFELHAASLIPIPKIAAAMPKEESIIYRGDFDGNGVADIFLMGNRRPIRIMNLATGAEPPVIGTYKQAGQTPESAAIGNLDGDGKDDVVIALAGSVNHLEVQLSKSATPMITNLPMYPTAVAIGDFNGDGKNDVAVGYKDNATVQIFVGDGQGVLQSGQLFSLTTAFPMPRIVAMAVTEAGPSPGNPQKLLTAVRSPDVQIYNSKLFVSRFDSNLNNTDNSVDIMGVPEELVTGRFSSTNSVDAVIAVGGSSLTRVKSVDSTMPIAESFSLNTYAIESGTPSKGKLAVGRMLTGSLDAGLDDLAVLQADGYLSIYGGGKNWATTTARLVNRSLFGEHIAAGRFAAGDLQDDLVVHRDTAEGGTLSIARTLSGTSANFTLPHDLRGPNTNHPDEIVVSGSFSAVGKQEIVLLGGASTVMLCRPDGSGGATCPTSLPTGQRVVTATTMSCPDQVTRIVAAYDNNDIVTINLQQGGGTSVLAKASNGVAQLEVGDINNDGSPDILVRETTGELSLLLGNKDVPCSLGRTLLSLPAFLQDRVLPSARNVVLSDLNGDGLTDLILGATRQLVVVPGGPPLPTNGGTATLSMQGDPIAIAAAYFLGQGQREVIVAVEVAGQTQLSLVQLRDKVLSETELTNLPMPTLRLAAADLNGDGRGEVVVLHGGRRALSLVGWGSTGSVSVRSYALGPSPVSLAFGQMLGDAKGPLDVIVADSANRRDDISGSVWILQGIRGGPSSVN